MPFPVEAISPEGANVRVSLVISFVVGALESVRAWFALLSFSSRGVNLGISFATPTKFPMML